MIINMIKKLISSPGKPKLPLSLLNIFIALSNIFLINTSIILGDIFVILSKLKNLISSLCKNQNSIYPFRKGGLRGILIATKTFSPIIILILITLIPACGTQTDQTEPMLSPQHYLQNGWDEYKSGNYSSSIIAFERALSADSDLADAYNGLGWAYISYSSDPIINLTNLNTALNKFDQALAIDSKNSDAWVGKAILIFIDRESKQDLNESIKAIDKALQGQQIYLYRHDYDSKADLHALKAQCYYYLDEYEKASAEIENALEIEKENQVALKIKTLLQ